MQLGTDARVRLDDVRPWQERALAALADGVSEGTLAALARHDGVDAAELALFVEAVRPALAPTVEPRPVVEVVFDGPVTSADRRIVEAAVRASGLDEPAPVDPAGAPAREASPVPTGGARDDAAAAPSVLVVAALLVAPERTAALTSADRTHVPILLAGDRVEVGPRIVPGQTACDACVHAARTDHDPLWPTVAVQLLSRRPQSTSPALLVEAVAVAAGLLSDPVTPQSASVTLSARRSERPRNVHLPHPECWCRSLGRTARPAARVAPTCAPTTQTGFARPA